MTCSGSVCVAHVPRSWLWLSNGLEHRETGSYLPAYQSVDIGIVSTFCLAGIMLLWTFRYRFCTGMFLLSWAYVVTLCLTLGQLPDCFLKWLHLVSNPSSSVGASGFLHVLTNHLWRIWLSDPRCPSKCEMASHRGFDSYSLTLSTFACAYWPFVYLLRKNVCHILCQFFF